MEFVPIEVYQSYIDAHIVMGRLQSAGIDCWLKDEITSTTASHLVQAVGGIKLMVRKEDEVRAKEELRSE